MRKKLIFSFALIGILLLSLGSYAYYLKRVDGRISANTGKFVFYVNYNGNTFNTINLAETVSGGSSDGKINPGDKISVPIVFFHASKICYFVANVSLFLGELLFASIIHIRKIRFIQVLGRTFKLIFATILIFNITMSYLLKGGYDLIKFSIYFAVATYICLILSRYIELSILKYNRLRGRNIKTVLFIGNDPAVIEMYNSAYREIGRAHV